MMVISRRSVSPGTTGRRNFALVDRCQQHQLAMPVLYMFQHQHARRLRQRLHDQHARHYREVRKVTLEERFVGRRS